MIGTEGKMSSYKAREEHKYGQFYREASMFGGVIVALEAVEGSSEVLNWSN